MCDPVSIGIGIAVGASTGAVGAAITGQDIGKGALMGGIMGGITGGFFPGSVGVTPGFDMLPGLGFNVLGSGVSYAGLTTAVGVGLVGSIAKGVLLPDPPDYSGYTPISQVVQQQNSQNIATTGSGGRQATASLAEAIKRSKKRKLTQEDVGDLSIDTGSFANTGLQLA